MQAAPSLDLAFLGIPGIFIGLFIGYILGGIDTYNSITRIILGGVINILGGLIISLFIGILLEVLTSFEVLFIILSMLGGFALGLFLNWNPYIDTSQRNHIIYNPEEDDEEFDRQIEEALGGKK